MLIRYYLKLLSIPLLFLVIFLLLLMLRLVVNMPNAQEITEVAQEWFSSYGLPALFLVSFIEAILMVGNYFPGTFIIFLGMTLAQSVPEAIVTAIIIIAGLFSAHLFNYVLGKYGWYKLLVKFGLKKAVEDSRKRLLNKGPTAILSTYWLPNLGAITDTAAGIIQMTFKRFFIYSLASTILWGAFFAVIAYSFKGFVITALTPGKSGNITVFIVIAAWITILLISDFLKNKKDIVI